MQPFLTCPNHDYFMVQHGMLLCGAIGRQLVWPTHHPLVILSRRSLPREVLYLVSMEIQSLFEIVISGYDNAS